MEIPAPTSDLPSDPAGQRGRLLRRLPAVLAVIAFLFGAYDGVTTLVFVVRAEVLPGVVISREPAGFRSWRITVEYGGGDQEASHRAAEGYYPAPEFDPGAAVAVYRAGTEVRLGPAVDLWITSLFSVLLGGCLFAVHRLISK